MVKLRLDRYRSIGIQPDCLCVGQTTDTSKNFGTRDLNDLYISTAPQFNKYYAPLIKYGIKPSPRYGHAAAVIGTNMYIFGGTFEFGPMIRELWMYNALDSIWTQIVEQYNLDDAPMNG